MMNNPRIISVQWGWLEGRRPRSAGSNARLGEHGVAVKIPLLRLETEDGYKGFGACNTTIEHASALLGARINDMFVPDQGVVYPWLAFDYPLWDLMGQRATLPVYALAAAMFNVGVFEPYRVPCYDTSLYFDDLHLTTNEQAARLIAEEAREGYRRGHRAFKIKIGRGARHLPLEEGTRRDIAVVHAVREAIGPHLPIMLDANNGYNLNLTKRVLSETAECNILWIEEAFHEDPVLYRELRIWLKEMGLPILISDGEGQADPHLLDWTREGLVDVIQYDILNHGFTRWLATGRQLDAWSVRSAPHHYGSYYGNYVAAHLAGAIRNFMYIEWDEATMTGLEAPGYVLSEGWVSEPDTPGFGLVLDEAVFDRFVQETGFSLSL